MIISPREFKQQICFFTEEFLHSSYYQRIYPEKVEKMCSGIAAAQDIFEKEMDKTFKEYEIWYKNKECKDEFEKIFYGKAKTFQEAKSLAYACIRKKYEGYNFEKTIIYGIHKHDLSAREIIGDEDIWKYI